MDDRNLELTNYMYNKKNKKGKRKKNWEKTTFWN